jgi:hypothetical protein
MEFVVIGALCAFASIWLLTRSPVGPQKKTTARKAAQQRTALRHKKGQEVARHRNPYQSVSIKRTGGACAAAQALGNKRFLVAEAPVTPLPNCTAAHCQCKYIHHEQRRVEDSDRREIFQTRSGLYNQVEGVERRKARGRRKADREELYAMA